MDECGGFFDFLGIPFLPSFEDAAVRAVLVTRAYPDEKKWLIQCWFDQTFGTWNGARFDMQDSRVQMAKYLRATEFKTYEDMIHESYNGDFNYENIR